MKTVEEMTYEEYETVCETVCDGCPLVREYSARGDYLTPPESRCPADFAPEIEYVGDLPYCTERGPNLD